MRDVGELAGPKVYAERGTSADAGGGVLMVAGGRIEVRGRMRARQLGYLSELSALALEDGKGRGASLVFADGSSWHLTAERGGLTEFAHELEARLGVPGLVREAPPVTDQLRTAITPEARSGIFAIALAFAIILPMRWLCAELPALAWAALGLVASTLIATAVARAAQDPAPGGLLERLRAAHWGYTLVLPLAVAAGAALGLAAARGEATTRALEAQYTEASEQQLAAKQAAEANAQKANRARADAIAKKLQAALEEGDFRKAQSHFEAILAIDPKHPALASAKAKLEPELARLDELDRLKAVQRGMRAVRLMKRDRVRCERANDVASAWRDLRQVRPADPEWNDAQTLVAQLERCRTRVQVLVVRSAGGARRQQLELETRALQSQLRSDGHDARAECKGSTCSEIVVTIPGLDAKLANAITDGGSRVATALLGRLERAGAERVVFTGVERVTYSLQPTDLAEAGKELLARAQLDAPLELGGAAAEADGPTADDLRPR